MKPPENLTLVIFGASGDLTYKKLLPSIYDMQAQGMAPDSLRIIGTGRTKLSSAEFGAKMQEAALKYASHKGQLQGFWSKLEYLPLEPGSEADFAKLAEMLADGKGGTQNAIFYLSVPPTLYSVIAKKLHQAGLASQDGLNGWKRLIVEKPFGTDYESAIGLNKELQTYFHESQIYRIDHYLGKETAQNIIVTRFLNGIFEPLWNRNYIEYIEITSSENIGVEKRGGYYDGSGALRDMLQNHLLLLASLTAMEPPVEFASEALRNEIVKVFQSLKPLNRQDLETNLVRGQYIASGASCSCTDYTGEEGVPANSRTETFVALKFYIDNWRWGGVPFYIRTGKKLPTRVTEIVVHFKPTPHPAFKYLGTENHKCQLVIRIQPDEGILLKFGHKVPGAGFKVQPGNMGFKYSDISDAYVPSAYERLIHDCMIGDSSLFARADAVELAWKFVQPILDYWKEEPSAKLYGYPCGTWGPKESDALIEHGGKWRYPCKNLIDDGNYCEL
jgi:glucose-6-phosphate 1-dehydrogenase